MKPANKTGPDLLSDYPDVLGTITGGARHHMGILQCAFTVYPRAAAIGQPLEALVLLQNMCDKPLQPQISLQLPRKDAAGQRMAVVAAKEHINVTLQPGEVGLLHIPVVPYPPTQPSQNNPMAVKVEVRSPGRHQLVRHAEHGRAPASLGMSTIRLNIMREAGFAAKASSPGVLLAPFNVLAGEVGPVPSGTVRYESLWTTKELAAEQALYQQQLQTAEKFAESLVSSVFLEPLISQTSQRFAAAGMPLHPGEAIFVAKALGYVLEEAAEMEEHVTLQSLHWFPRLVGVIADRFVMDDMDRLMGHLFGATVQDAVPIGLNMVERLTKLNLGSPADHATYSNEIVTALETYKPLDLGHIYLPLILMGLHFNQRIIAHKENGWKSFILLQEAWQHRSHAAHSTFGIIGETLADFFAREEEELHRMRVPRPS